ncbi:MAG: hypothetical protein ACAH81_02450 [Actinomycetota bacterium]
MIPPDDTPGPWTRASRSLVYENAWIQVFHDEVLRPGGEPGVYGVVHPRTHAVGVIALDERDRVLLVGQYRYTLELLLGDPRGWGADRRRPARRGTSGARRGDRIPNGGMA